MTIIPHNDPRICWQGEISLEQTPAYTMPWRLPITDLPLFAPTLVERAAMPAGVRVAFRSDSQRLTGHILPPVEATQVDICCDGQLVATIPLTDVDRFQADLPTGEKLVELWLPQYGAFRLTGLELDDGASLMPYMDPRPRWITYGSSITHCRTAQSPIYTWPAIVARERDYNLTCLGYGGNCHLDPLVACMIRDHPADLISMCVGINIYGGSSLGERTFRWNLLAFARIIREKHPQTPMIIMSPIYSPPRENTPNDVGLTLARMRFEVQEAVRLLQAQGDERVYYVNGLDIFGADLAHLLPDDLHPNADGYKAMGRNFLDVALADMAL